MTLRFVCACAVMFLICSQSFAQKPSPDPAFLDAGNGVGIRINEGLNSEPDAGGPVGELHGCVYRVGPSQFQAVKFKMKRSAIVRFDALLYRGASCGANKFLDEFGFGNKLSLSKGTWIFWFVDFAGQLDTSGRWHVGKKNSACVNYEVAPDC
jgi:hypothetical protein